MRRVIALNSLALDGVMQAPGRPDEDERGGFTHGGWAIPYMDSVQMQAMGRSMAGEYELLLGRRTYEDFYKVWPARTESPFSAVLTNTRKYVTSRTSDAALPWQNSVRLTGDAAVTVAALKAQSGPDLVVMGSGALLRALLPAGLVDQWTLQIHPLLLGRGQQLFQLAGCHATFRLVDSLVTSTGVIIATYAAA